jgi:hypothetical protein
VIGIERSCSASSSEAAGGVNSQPIKPSNPASGVMVRWAIADSATIHEISRTGGSRSARQAPLGPRPTAALRALAEA